MRSPRDAVATFQLPPGFEVRLVAAEPELINPMTMTLDEQGRIYVSQSHTYRYGPEQSPVDPPTNPVVRLELDGEGRVVDRVMVANGFENPVMGLAVREDRLWATHLNEVWVADLDQQGRATARRTIVRDAATPWNPFGMYRIAWGPDGRLYLSVGDHAISLTGLTNTVTVRGNTGGLFRFRPDGSEIELLAQGMRAPFSFDLDPFGRLWLISNGEGNPNRLIPWIPGADYHFQTRPVDWDWLAGKHPWAPPVWETAAGAHTAVLAYRSDAFPEEYWGNLFLSNWGVHGFPSANHVIVRHVIDQRGNHVRSEPFLTTTDPHFRPTQICHAPNGGLYVLDWYGRDDENDLTGRLYEIVYVGTAVTKSQAEETTAGLASRSHRVRARTRRKLMAVGPEAADSLEHEVTGTDPLAAAEALWILEQSDWPAALSLMQRGLNHPDWRVRRLAVQLLGERATLPDNLSRLLEDAQPAVAIEAALAVSAPAERLAALTAVLRRGAARDPRLRYRAALEVARHGAPSHFELLLNDPDAKVRLAGLIALDEAFHEGSDTAAEILAGRISEPQRIGLRQLLAIGQHWPDRAMVSPVVSQLNRDVTVSEFAQGLAILQLLEIPLTRKVLGEAVERLLRRLHSDLGKRSKADKISALTIAAIDGSAPSALSIVTSLAKDADVDVRAAAHRAIAAGAERDGRLVALCWDLANDDSLATESRMDGVASLVQIESECGPKWLDLLRSTSPRIALASVRSLQNYAGQAKAAEMLERVRTELLSRGEPLASELSFVQRSLAPSEPSDVSSTSGEDERAALRERLLAHSSEGDPLLGQLAFRRGACSRCHLADNSDTLLGPRLNGVAKTNSLEYIVDSVLYPSRVIKTGFMVEMVVTDEGEGIIGKVTEEGDQLTITTADGDRHQIARENVDERHPMKLSLMPEGLDTSMSEAELLDLIAYLLEQ